MSERFGSSDNLIPHWTSPATKSVLGASYQAVVHNHVLPRTVQTTVDTVSSQPAVTGAVNTGAYRTLVSVANRQAMNAAMSNQTNPWDNTACTPCNSVTNAYVL